MGRLSADHIKDPNRRVKAETIMGEAGYANQKSRAIQSRVKAMKAGKNTDLADAREAVLRVKEYKAAKHGKRRK